MDGTLGAWAATALARLEEVFPSSDHTNRSVWRMYLPHARYALEMEGDGSERKKAKLLWKFAMCTCSDRSYNESEQAFVQVMETNNRVLGKEHLDTLNGIADLASTFYNQG
jgi:hypothetical protein